MYILSRLGVRDEWCDFVKVFVRYICWCFGVCVCICVWCVHVCGGVCVRWRVYGLGVFVRVSMGRVCVQ